MTEPPEDEDYEAFRQQNASDKVTRHWQKMVARIRVRDDSLCARCGDENALIHVHHLYYEAGKRYWEYPEEAFICLCERCHQDEHRRILQGKKKFWTAIGKLGGRGWHMVRLSEALEKAAFAEPVDDVIDALARLLEHPAGRRALMKNYYDKGKRNPGPQPPTSPRKDH